MRNGVVDDEDSRQRNCWRCEWEAGRIAMWVNGYRMWLSLLHPYQFCTRRVRLRYSNILHRI